MNANTRNTLAPTQIASHPNHYTSNISQAVGVVGTRVAGQSPGHGTIHKHRHRHWAE